MASSIVLFCVALAVPQAVAEVFSRKPWQLKQWDLGWYALSENTLACPEGFSLSCKPICCTVGQSGTCADFGVNFTVSALHYCNIYDSWDTKSQECCECVSSAPAITSLPQSTGIKWVTSQDCELASSGRFRPTSCGLANLTCPEGFALSSPMMGCSPCPDRYATRVKLNSSDYCVTHGYGFEATTYPPSWVCQTCVQETVGTTTSTTTAIRYGGLDPTCTDGGFRDWEVVGVEGAGACRGNHANDNNGSYYHVVPAYSINECKGKCILELPKCKGIEYSFGRCEIWTRPEGIFVTKNLQNFTCLRYGWPTKYLQPMDGGSDRACRRTTATDNSNRYYRVQKSMHLEDCKARCSAHRWECDAIEFSPGRCEIWKVQVGATANIPGFQCFRYEDPRTRRLSPKLPTETILPWLAPTGAEAVLGLLFFCMFWFCLAHTSWAGHYRSCSVRPFFFLSNFLVARWRFQKPASRIVQDSISG